GEAHRRRDGVGALAGIFRDRVAGVVDDISVVAVAADHGVGAGLAVDDVGGVVAGDLVGRAVAGAVDWIGPGQDQVLDVDRQRVAHRRFDGVGAALGGLDDNVAGVVDEIGVVAGAAGHDVGAAHAVD